MPGSKKIGLAIGSGAVRGFSAMPIVQRIQAEGIEITAASGSSIGAVLASYLALHGELDSLFERVRDIPRKRWLRLIDPNRPKRSLIKGKKLKRFLGELFLEDKTFSDTRIPLIICLTDYGVKKSVYMTEGSLLDAVMASLSIPGIFPPHEVRDGFFIDGGVLDPVPVQPLLDMGLKKVVGLNFMGFRNAAPPGQRDFLPALVSAFYMMMEKIAVRENSENLFMLNIEFDPDPANMLSFWKSRDYYDVGKEFIGKNIDPLLDWL